MLLYPRGAQGPRFTLRARVSAAEIRVRTRDANPTVGSRIAHISAEFANTGSISNTVQIGNIFPAQSTPMALRTFLFRTQTHVLTYTHFLQITCSFFCFNRTQTFPKCSTERSTHGESISVECELMERKAVVSDTGVFLVLHKSTWLQPVKRLKFHTSLA